MVVSTNGLVGNNNQRVYVDEVRMCDGRRFQADGAATEKELLGCFKHRRQCVCRPRLCLLSLGGRRGRVGRGAGSVTIKIRLSTERIRSAADDISLLTVIYAFVAFLQF